MRPTLDGLLFLEYLNLSLYISLRRPLNWLSTRSGTLRPHLKTQNGPRSMGSHTAMCCANCRRYCAGLATR